MTKAAVLNKIPGELEIQDVTVDKPRANEVLVRVVASGLCHSDLHFMEGPVADQAAGGHGPRGCRRRRGGR